MPKDIVKTGAAIDVKAMTGGCEDILTAERKSSDRDIRRGSGVMIEPKGGNTMGADNDRAIVAGADVVEAEVI